MAIITISRGTLSGGQMLAEMLGKRLNYSVVSREIIVEATEKFGVPEFKLYEAIQKSPTIWQRLTFEREKYLAIIQATLCEYVKENNVIYHGHAGHFLLKGVSHVLRVRIVADMPFRIRQAMERHRLSEKEAIKYIEEVDKQRSKWTKFLYGEDWRSPDLYDMIFNIKNASLEFVCEMIAHAVTLPDFKETPESKQQLEDLLLGSKVRAELCTKGNIRLSEVDARAQKGVIILSGKVKSEDTLRKAIELAKEIPGVKEVRSNLRLDYRYQSIDA